MKNLKDNSIDRILEVWNNHIKNNPVDRSLETNTLKNYSTFFNALNSNFFLENGKLIKKEQ